MFVSKRFCVSLSLRYCSLPVHSHFSISIHIQTYRNIHAEKGIWSFCVDGDCEATVKLNESMLTSMLCALSY